MHRASASATKEKAGALLPHSKRCEYLKATLLGWNGVCRGKNLVGTGLGHNRVVRRVGRRRGARQRGGLKPGHYRRLRTGRLDLEDLGLRTLAGRILLVAL